MNVRFPGFDGNNEGELMHIARHFVREMGRWQDFKKHDMNSHAPMADVYRRMLSEFDPRVRNLGARSVLGVADLAVILNAMNARR